MFNSEPRKGLSWTESHLHTGVDPEDTLYDAEQSKRTTGLLFPAEASVMCSSSHKPRDSSSISGMYTRFYHTSAGHNYVADSWIVSYWDHLSSMNENKLMKSSVSWDVNRRVTGTYRLHLQVIKMIRAKIWSESRWNVSLNLRLNFNGQDQAISRKMELSITTAVRTWDRTKVNSMCKI